jgi:predicted MFS family arabinose efflux permease
MSLNSASMGLGSAVGASLGGFVLLFGNYAMLGLLIGILNTISAIIYFYTTIDPQNS